MRAQIGTLDTLEERPSAEVLRQLVRQGLTDEQIGAMYNVTRTAVANWRKKLGINKAPRNSRDTKHERYLPWKLSKPATRSAFAARVRDLSAYEQGYPLDPAAERRVLEFLHHILVVRKSVIDYDPTFRPEKDGGFKLSRRDPKLDDPDDIIRRPVGAPRLSEFETVRLLRP